MSTYPADGSGVLNLDPATSQTLEEFDRRRRALLTLRGIAAGIVAFVAVMLVVALVDYLFLLPDSMRWGLSVAGYVATAAAAWWFGWRLIRDRDPRHLARRIESAEPVLREDLLSAVELADPDDANGSPVFRERLQGRVARRISKLNVARLLPVGLIRRWLSTGLFVLAVCFLCLLFPSMQFGRRFARAMLPGVAIERASQTVVKIIEPSPASGYVAEGDAVAVIVEISGEPADIVTMHWRTEDGIVGETEMTPRVIPSVQGDSEDESVSSASESTNARSYEPDEIFAANLSIGSVPVEYRITAGDAITLWHELTPLPRPRVSLFTKRYQFPKYAKLNDRVEEDEYGDLKALVGTMANLTVRFDEPVEHAVIRFGNQAAEIPMKQADESGASFSVSVPIKTAGQYQVDAASVRSGLNNPFSPTYTITPIIDAPPVVRWAPNVARLQLVSPLEVLSLGGEIRDDLPVDDVFQEFEINREARKKRPIETVDSAREMNPTWEWDLMHRNDSETATPKLQPGDIVRTRLVAVDRRRNRGESQTIELLIADDGFDADRHARIDELAALTTKLIEWSKAAGELAESVKSIVNAPEGADLAETSKSLENLNELTATTMDAVSESLALATNVPQAGLIELMGRVVGDVDRRQSLSLATLEDVLGDTHQSWKRTRDRSLNELNTAASRTKHQTDRLEAIARAIVGQYLSVAVMNDAISLNESLARLVDNENPLPADRYPRHLTVVKGRLETIDQLISKYSDVIPQSTQSHFQGENWVRWSQRWAVQFEKAIENPPGEKNYRALVERFDNELSGKIDYALYDGRLQSPLANYPRDARREIGMMADWLRHGLQAAMAAQSDRDRKEKETDSNQIAGLNRSEKYHVANFNRLVSAVIDKATSEEDLHRQRPSVDLRYAADLGLFQKAIENVTREGFQPYREEPPQQVFDNLTRAIQVLEAAHEANLWHQELLALLAGERRPQDIGTAKLQHPLWLERYSLGMEWPVATLRNLNLPHELMAPIDETRHNTDFNLARERITKRRWDRQEPLTAETVVEKISLQLQGGIEGLEPEVTAAREMILRYVLTLPEQAREAAKKAKEAEERTDERKDSAQETANELAEQQREAEQAAAETVEQLVDKANNADIQEQQERELARDADIAAAQIQEAMKEAQQQMANAESAPHDQDRSEALERTEQALDELAETLEKTAEHFEKAEAGEDVSESRQELRDAEAEMEARNQIEERFDEAEAMANAANSDPREMLKKLEQELQRNELMQEELSEISEQAADNAQRALEQAANDERSLNQRIESTDQEFQEQKRRAVRQIAELSQRANTVENAILSTAEQAVGWANDPESRPTLQQARQDIRDAVNKANQLGGENALLAEMREAAKEMTDAIKKADQAVDQVQQDAAKNAEEDVHKDEAKRKKSQQSMERAASSLRNRRVQLQNPMVQQWVQEENNAKRRETQAKSQQRRFQDAKKRVENQLGKDPDNESLKQQAKNYQQQADDAQQVAEAAKETREFSRQKRQQVDRRTSEIRKQSIPKLNKPNPAAQLAQETTRQAGDELEAIAKELSELGAQLDFGDELESPAQELQGLANRQNQITEDVDNAAEALARAARHEERLGKQAASEMLQQAAESVQQNASEATQQAQQALQAAAEDTSQTPQANQNVSNATEQIAQEAQRLAEMMQAQAAESEGQPTSETQSGRPSDDAQQKAQQMAQTLDELDRALAQQSQQSQGQPSQQANSQQAGQPQDGQPGQQPPSESQNAAQSSQTLSSMMDAQNQQAARQRMQQMQAAQQGNQNPSEQPSENPQRDISANGLAQMPEGMELDSEFQFDGINGDWGKLREQRPDDASESRSVRVAPQYRREVQAYFRAIAKRAAEKKE